MSKMALKYLSSVYVFSIIALGVICHDVSAHNDSLRIVSLFEPYDAQLEALTEQYYKVTEDEELTGKKKKKSIGQIIQEEVEIIKRYEVVVDSLKVIYLEKCDSILADTSIAELVHKKSLYDNAQMSFINASALKEQSSEFKEAKDENFKLIEAIESTKSGILLLLRIANYKYVLKPEEHSFESDSLSEVSRNKEIIPVVAKHEQDSIMPKEEVYSENQIQKDTVLVQKMDMQNKLDYSNIKPKEKAYPFYRDTLYRPSLITSFDKTSLLEFWYTYRNASIEKIDIAKPIAQIHDTVSVKSKTVVEEEVLAISSEAVSNDEGNIRKSNSDLPKVSVQADDVKEDFVVDTVVSPKLFTNKLEFWIQIAAARVPLNDSSLKLIYLGNEQIHLRQEEGWYKYQIYKSANFADAFENLKTTAVDDAFIAAYKENQKQNLVDLIYKEKISVSDLPKTQKTVQINYYIQILASKRKESAEKLKLIYNGAKDVREISEEGLYKYQILGGPTFLETLEELKKIDVGDAFVVPYKNGEKIPLKEAVKITR